MKSQFNRLYSTCNRVQSTAVCGKSFINLEAVGNNDKVDISNLTAGASCAYKVFSKCGFPAFDINATNIDVAVISQAGKDSNTDMGDNDTFSGNEAAVVRPKNGKIDFVFNGTSEKDAECGKMRKMFVVITNIPATTGRILQTAGNYAITFSATAGGSSSDESFGVSIKTASVALLAMMMAVFF